MRAGTTGSRHIGGTTLCRVTKDNVQKKKEKIMRKTLLSTICAGAGYIHGPTRYYPDVSHQKEMRYIGRGDHLAKV